MRSKLAQTLSSIPTRSIRLPQSTLRCSSTKVTGQKPTPKPQQGDADLNIKEFLSQPTWSVQSLVPPANDSANERPVSAEKLRHLLRLSALPEPKDEKEEARLMQDLASQLHFVKEIQKVDTKGVEPLRAIRDETLQAEQEAELTVEKLQEAFDNEEVLGKYHKRIRRRKDIPVVDEDTPPDWKPLDHAKRRQGDFFVVSRSKEPTP
ncbi:hypothetical protein BT63DRAFT_320985 [Microthyrium microscopicum]|uniref:Glutamyl-tRNA amidotransferase complex subunit Gta3 domain-containing protein n=1 Tax=Microthyrium microscopicum TaxID=703497 RepID=A0A6A6U5L6_9PEZI|nr:hypothetical protein BT63DRAFT_320985 [Microthyrium microscopicum]